MDKTIVIRKAQIEDSQQLFHLMKALAEYEHYIDTFAITPEVAANSGFIKKVRDFFSIVAEDTSSGRIAGMLVYYLIPYTAQNRPAVYLKELFVDQAYRGKKIGEKLMEELRKEARKNNCTQIKWTVAPWNEAGKKFYEKLGAKENKEWLNYEWDILQ